MQVFGRVTIIALLGGVLGLAPGCGSTEGQRVGDGDRAGSSEAVLGPGGAVARVDQALGMHRAGDLDGAEVIVEQVLSVEPAHPGALKVRECLERTSYCTVYPGDTLSEIAAYYYGDVDRWTVLARANGISDPKSVKAYARLRVPWYPDGEPGKDELGRLQRKSLLGKGLEKIVVLPAGENDTLESLARKHYGSKRYRFFLADFNRLETRAGPLAPGTALKIPVFKEQPARKSRSVAKKAQPPPRSPREECLDAARDAMKNHEYERGCDCLVGLTDGSGSWPEGEGLLARCRAEGVAHYEARGEAALQASELERACGYWEQALVLEPENRRVKQKLQETRDLMKTMASLPEIP